MSAAVVLPPPTLARLDSQHLRALRHKEHHFLADGLSDEEFTDLHEEIRVWAKTFLDRPLLVQDALTLVEDLDANDGFWEMTPEYRQQIVPKLIAHLHITTADINNDPSQLEGAEHRDATLGPNGHITHPARDDALLAAREMMGDLSWDQLSAVEVAHLDEKEVKTLGRALSKVAKAVQARLVDLGVHMPHPPEQSAESKEKTVPHTSKATRAEFTRTDAAEGAVGFLGQTRLHPWEFINVAVFAPLDVHAKRLQSALEVAVRGVMYASCEEWENVVQALLALAMQTGSQWLLEAVDEFVEDTQNSLGFMPFVEPSSVTEDGEREDPSQRNFLRGMYARAPLDRDQWRILVPGQGTSSPTGSALRRNVVRVFRWCEMNNWARGRLAPRRGDSLMKRPDVKVMGWVV